MVVRVALAALHLHVGVLLFLCSVYTPGIHVRQQLGSYQRCRLGSFLRKSTGCSTISGQRQVSACAYTNVSTGFALSYFCTWTSTRPFGILFHQLHILDKYKHYGLRSSLSKAWYFVLFLDSGMLQLVLTRAAREALHYRPFGTIFYGDPLAQCTPDVT